MRFLIFLSTIFCSTLYVGVELGNDDMYIHNRRGRTVKELYSSCAVTGLEVENFRIKMTSGLKKHSIYNVYKLIEQDPNFYVFRDSKILGFDTLLTPVDLVSLFLHQHQTRLQGTKTIVAGRDYYSPEEAIKLLDAIVAVKNNRQVEVVSESAAAIAKASYLLAPGVHYVIALNFRGSKGVLSFYRVEKDDKCKIVNLSRKVYENASDDNIRDIIYKHVVKAVKKKIGNLDVSFLPAASRTSETNNDKTYTCDISPVIREATKALYKQAKSYSHPELILRHNSPSENRMFDNIEISVSSIRSDVMRYLFSLVFEIKLDIDSGMENFVPTETNLSYILISDFFDLPELANFSLPATMLNYYRSMISVGATYLDDEAFILEDVYKYGSVSGSKSFLPAFLTELSNRIKFSMLNEKLRNTCLTEEFCLLDKNEYEMLTDVSNVVKHEDMLNIMKQYESLKRKQRMLKRNIDLRDTNVAKLKSELEEVKKYETSDPEIWNDNIKTQYENVLGWLQDSENNQDITYNHFEDKRIFIKSAVQVAKENKEARLNPKKEEEPKLPENFTKSEEYKKMMDELKKDPSMFEKMMKNFESLFGDGSRFNFMGHEDGKKEVEKKGGEERVVEEGNKGGDVDPVAEGDKKESENAPKIEKGDVPEEYKMQDSLQDEPKKTARLKREEI